ncbi:uncharacterized protein LOC142526005 [Primulina tabacum]|uniref:uncharacterized protein LOC142526005 n=1 Tax=Primulina tabacum TaxID=48773 RepID=UPI003F595774
MVNTTTETTEGALVIFDGENREQPETSGAISPGITIETESLFEEISAIQTHLVGIMTSISDIRSTLFLHTMRTDSIKDNTMGELEYNPEIEKTSKRLRKQARLRREKQPSSLSPCLDVSLDSDEDTERESKLDLKTERSESDQEEMAGQAQRTLRELANPNVIQQPLCIQFPTTDATFELKSGLIHLLPTFRGLAGEDPHKHLKEFHIVCTAMKPQRITEEQISLRAFPFSLADKAKDWLYYLPSGTITTWDNMKQQFLEKFFPASRAANIRKDICGIRQLQGEALYEYWERFKQLCSSCPQHQIPEQLLVQYFYKGLSLFDRNMIDAASGGALVNKTPQEARALISNMAANAQQFRQVQQLKTCGVCAMVGHPTDMCPALQEETTQQANAIGGFPGQPQRRYDPYSNSYNPGWRDHPNFSYKNQGGQQGYPQQNWNKQHAPEQTSNSGMSLDEIVKALAENTQKFQQETRASIQNLGTQITQIATSVSKLETQNSGKLPSQTVVNPKENASAMILRSGKEINQKNTSPTKDAEERGTNEEIEGESEKQPKVNSKSFSSTISNVVVPPFPSRLEKSKKMDYETEVLETFRKVEINIPLIDAIKQIPRYAKFLKDLCTNKRRLKSDEKVSVGENVSAVIKKSLPNKCKDPGMLTMHCVNGNLKIERAMLDFGASINVMPYSIYCALNLGPLKETRVVIQLADRSNAYPEGVVEDVLVQVKELIFPADFYILRMEEDSTAISATILLGRSFMKTARTKIDVEEGTLSVEFDGEIVKFSIFDAMKYPNENHSICSIDIVDSIVQEHFEETYEIDSFHMQAQLEVEGEIAEAWEISKTG